MDENAEMALWVVALNKHTNLEVQHQCLGILSQWLK